MNPRKLLAWFIAAGLTAVMFGGVAVVAGRVSAAARFVTWPVVGFTALAALTAVVGVWFGRFRPALLAAGLLFSLPLSYVLSAAPMFGIAFVLVCLGGLAITTGEGAAGVATGVGALMVLLVVLQGPAVECRDSGVSANSGPWWIESSESSSSRSTSLGPGGAVGGTTQVGDREYEYRCEGDRLTRFRGVG